MKKVLIVAFFFPPLGSVGTQRSLKFVKYLSKKGWKVFVVSAKPARQFDHDEELFKDVPCSVRIHRAYQLSINSFLDMLRRYKMGTISTLLSKLILPDLQVGWFFPAYLMAKKIIEEENIKIIYTTSSPVTAHFIGLLLKKRNPSLKWVADFRDPWSLNAIMYGFLGTARKRIDRILERRVLNAADEVIITTESNRIDLLKSFNIPEHKVTTITNGYDEDDFQVSHRKPCNGFFKITYAGSAYGNYNPKKFIQAVIPLLKSNPRIKLYFIGECSLWVHDYLVRNSLFDKFIRFFNLIAYVPYSKALQFLINSDLLLLFLPNEAAAVLPGKIFELIRCEVPILAIVPPEGEAAKIIRDTHSGVVINPDDINEISKTLMEYYKKWKKGKLEHIQKQGESEKYRRDILTDKLIRILNR